MTSAVGDNVAGALPVASLAPSALLRELTDIDSLLAWRQRADRLLQSEGAGYLVHDLPVRSDGRVASTLSRPWRLDPLPVVLDAAVFDWLAAAVAERMSALDATLADWYGGRRTLGPRFPSANGQMVDAAALSSSNAYRLSAVGAPNRRWLTIYAADVALGVDGVWYLVNDLSDAPSGVGYALLGRSIMSRVMPKVMGGLHPAALSWFPDAMRNALAATSGQVSPRIVVFSGGLDDPSYVDHSYLAVQLGVHLVEGTDLVVRGRRVWLRTLSGLEQIDVLYRRVDDVSVDPLEVGSVGAVGVPGLLQAVRSSGVALANAHGSGVLQDPSLVGQVDRAIAQLTPLQQALPRWTPSIELATMPVLGDDGELVERRVVIRLHAVHDGKRARVLTGGSGRVLAPDDDPRVPTAAVAKDVWVTGRLTTPRVRPRLPQVDLHASLPTRAADALYWMNRTAERAEAIARFARVVISRVEQDRALLTIDDGRLEIGLARILSWVGGLDPVAETVLIGPHPADDCVVDRADDRVVGGADGHVAGGVIDPLLAALRQRLAVEIGMVLNEAITVREYLSITTGRVLSHLGEVRHRLVKGRLNVEELDELLADFAALAGLWHESTVRGPAWRIGDAGRRLERCLIVVDSVTAALGRNGDGDYGAPLGDDARSVLGEVLLAGNESLVAYRRRHRSEVEPATAVRLLLQDRSNPRSVASCLVELRESLTATNWDTGEDLLAAATGALELPTAELLDTVREVISRGGAAIVERWFSSPVAPIVMTQS